MKIKKEKVDEIASLISDELLVDVLKNKFESICFENLKEKDKTICFDEIEIEFLKSLPNEKIKRLFYSLLCFEKLHWHESGWIRFEIDVPFGLKMRVTGSKNAVSTYYSIGWTIEKQTGKHRERKVVDVLGTECAEKFWEVVNASN